MLHNLEDEGTDLPDMYNSIFSAATNLCIWGIIISLNILASSHYLI